MVSIKVEMGLFTRRGFYSEMAIAAVLVCANPLSTAPFISPGPAHHPAIGDNVRTMHPKIETHVILRNFKLLRGLGASIESPFIAGFPNQMAFPFIIVFTVQSSIWLLAWRA